jgi:hypothetical protein
MTRMSLMRMTPKPSWMMSLMSWSLMMTTSYYAKNLTMTRMSLTMTMTMTMMTTMKPMLRSWTRSCWNLTSLNLTPRTKNLTSLNSKSWTSWTRPKSRNLTTNLTS